MAKSLRSKWRRKCRAVKRVRYGQKELERLKKTLQIDDTQQDAKMEEISEIATVKTAKEVIKKAKKPTTETSTEAPLEQDGETSKRVYNTRTLRDQHGSYPVWLHPRKIMSKSMKGKKGKSKTKKKVN